MATTRLYIDIEYDGAMTDGESIANAMDRLLETALSTPEIFSEYGDPSVGEFYTLWDLGDEEILEGDGDWDNMIARLSVAYKIAKKLEKKNEGHRR